MVTPRRLKVVAVVSKELAPLMKVLSIADVYVAEAFQEAERLVADLFKRGDVGVILVERSLLEKIKLPEDVEKVLWPIVVEFPDRPSDLNLRPELYYRGLIRRFIGYEIHIGVGG
jgi:vacuolar-type H+-ATPase subunit F/Vma7